MRAHTHSHRHAHTHSLTHSNRIRLISDIMTITTLHFSDVFIFGLLVAAGQMLRRDLIIWILSELKYQAFY